MFAVLGLAFALILTGCDGGGSSSPTRVYHTVTFHVHGGSTVQAQIVRDGQTAERPAEDPTRIGFTFVGWFTAQTGGNVFDFATEITRDTTIHAQWQAVAPGDTPGPGDNGGGGDTGNDDNGDNGGPADFGNPFHGTWRRTAPTPGGLYLTITATSATTGAWTATGHGTPDGVPVSGTFTLRDGTSDKDVTGGMRNNSVWLLSGGGQTLTWEFGTTTPRLQDTFTRTTP